MPRAILSFLISILLVVIGPLAKAKVKIVSEDVRLGLLQTRTLPDGLTLKFVSTYSESIAPSPHNPSDHGGAAVHFTIEAQEGSEKRSFEFSFMASGDGPRVAQSWRGRDFSIVAFQNETKRDVQITVHVGESGERPYVNFVGQNFADAEKAKAYRPPPTLKFQFLRAEFDPASEKIALLGDLVNSSSKPETAVFYPGAFFLNVRPSPDLQIIPESSAPRGAAPMPPQAFTIPANSRVRFVSTFPLERLRYRGQPKINLDWSFRYFGHVGASGESSLTLPNVKVAARASWSFVYNNFSAFHLDGSYVTMQSSGEFVGDAPAERSATFFEHLLRRGVGGANELVFQGSAPNEALPAELLHGLQRRIEALDFAKIKSPPPRTLLPDTVLTQVTFCRFQNGKTETVELRFVLGSPQDVLNEETRELLSIVRTFEANVEETKPVAQFAAVQNSKPHVNISKEDALKRAIKNGFSATWTEVALHGNAWVISGHSKSASPPSRHVISAFDGAVLKQSSNTDAESPLFEFKILPASESYQVEGIETKPIWKKD